LDIRTQNFSLEKGERVFLMTDGIIEARNAKGDLYGSEKFEKYLVDYSFETLREMVERFFLELDRFRGHFGIADDVTLVAVEYKG
jgi:sigma-B regulation protein RsbU (phosphoserine phosphatase)